MGNHLGNKFDNDWMRSRQDDRFPSMWKMGCLSLIYFLGSVGILVLAAILVFSVCLTLMVELGVL